MASENEPGPGSQPKTTLSLAGDELLITLPMAQQIQRALQTYLKSSHEEIAKTLPASMMETLPKQVGEAFIDPGGAVRMAPWLLEARGHELVLTYREVPPLPGVNVQYVAHLARVEPGTDWKVASITYAKIYPRR